MSTQGLAIVHYEVYTLDGQRWTLHARFNRDERDDALEEAKNVEQTLGLAAKVVRETYYPGNNMSEEALVYPGDKALRDRAVQAPTVRAGGHVPAPGRHGNFPIPEFADMPVAATKARKPSFGILAKLIIIVAGSLTIAGTATGVLNLFFAKMPSFAKMLGANTISLVLFSTFVVTFLATALPLAMSMIGWHEDGAGSSRRAKAKAQPRAPREKVRPKAEIVVRQPPVPEPPPPPDPAPPASEELEPGDDDELDWEGLDDDDAPLPPIEETPPIEPLPDPEQVKAEEEETVVEQPEHDEPARTLETTRTVMMHFLNGILGIIKKNRPILDAYNKFGLDLILAGAVDVLGNHYQLEGKDKRDVLRDTIALMGTKAETAQAFADKYEAYLMEPRYLSMLQAGRSAMEALIAGGEAGQDDITKVFELWNKPQQATQAGPRIMTILFTDMVGSTDMTQSRGDQAAQYVVRRHNNIVRGALAEFSGKEIKHTGDGIMASFQSAANGIEAAIAIQQAIAIHNEGHADQQLHVRIGMNSGEPIEEEDDLFGTTVQLAARVCAACGTDEILCTNVVRELSAGKGLTFVEKGAQELKGFKEPVPLFQVLWEAMPDSPAQAAVPDQESPVADAPRIN